MSTQEQVLCAPTEQEVSHAAVIKPPAPSSTHLRQVFTGYTPDTRWFSGQGFSKCGPWTRPQTVSGLLGGRCSTEEQHLEHLHDLTLPPSQWPRLLSRVQPRSGVIELLWRVTWRGNPSCTVGNTHRSVTDGKECTTKDSPSPRKACLRQGPARFSRKRPDGKYFRLCKPHVVSILYSFFLLFCKPLKI